jgi:hypothetical protein
MNIIRNREGMDMVTSIKKLAHLNAELKIRAPSTIQSLSVAAVDQIVERCYTFPFKKRTQVCIATNVEIVSILFLDCPYVGISTLLTEFTVLITAAIATHSRCIFCHFKSPFFIMVVLQKNHFIDYSNERYPFSSSLEIRLLSTSADTSYIPISFAAIAFTI